MALKVYYENDVRDQILSSAVSLLSFSVAMGGGDKGYYRGVLDMARAQALAYGIPWSGMVADFKEALGTDALEIAFFTG